MFENCLRVDLHASPRHHGQADAFAEPRIANSKCRRLFDRAVAQSERLDSSRVDVAAAADDHVLLPPGDTQIACLIDPAKIARHKPALRIECRLGSVLVVEIAEHQAGAAATDFGENDSNMTDYADCRNQRNLTDDGRKDARAIGHAPSLMIALSIADLTHMLCGNYAAGSERINELVALADEIGGAFWKLAGAAIRGRHLALIGNAADSIPLMIATRNAYEATGANFLAPLDLAILGSTHAALGKVNDARRYVADAMNSIETNKEKWFEAEVNRVAGEIALKSPDPDRMKAQEYFRRALAVARQQQAKSWELRAAMSLARLWRSQGKVQQAHELLAPVYGWFTEGFDTRDLKEAKALLQELAS